MSKSIQTKGKTTNKPSLSTYSFKTTGYVRMKNGIRRDHASGRLISNRSSKKIVAA